MKTISLKPYRRAAVPILAIQTADPAEVVRLAVTESQNSTVYPVIAWDCIHGFYPKNEPGQGITVELNGGMEGAIASSNPVEALSKMESLGDLSRAEKAIVVMFGMADVLADPQAGLPARQALWNLRDVLPRQGVLLVLAVPMGWVNPYPDDIAVAIAPLPEREDHAKIATRLCSDAKIAKPTKKTLETVSDAMLGLSSFASEQAIALSLTKKGIDTASLWSRKRQQISETPGLNVYDGSETFDDLGGLDQVKSLFSRFLAGKRRPGAIAFVDEIEKSVAGSKGDTSGTSQSILGYLLSYMQDMNATGSIFVGPPGAAKSAFAKAMGNEAQIPTVLFDVSGIKGSLVGESEGRMRKALAVLTAISGERPFFVATCNAISSLPPELRRRFTVGTIFFDLPTTEERETIWKIYLSKFSLGKQELPEAKGWTGAEIRQCCDMADRLGISVVEAAKFVVPVSISASEQISRLRQEATGRYLSASHEGIYRYESSEFAGARTSRKVNLD